MIPVYVNCLLATLSARNTLRSMNQEVSGVNFATPLAYPAHAGPGESDEPSSGSESPSNEKPPVVSLNFLPRTTDTESGGDSVILIADKRPASEKQHIMTGLSSLSF